MEFGNDFDLNPTTIFGDGDEYVNQRSLAGCSRWKNSVDRDRVYQREFLGLDHVTILDHSDPIHYIKDTLLNDPTLTRAKNVDENAQN